jgi:uncharacterized damage-inducible protein DinB
MKTATKPSREIEVLLEFADEAFDRKAWHGPNLWGAVRRLTAEDASARPGPGRPSIHEIVLHCAYWKYAVRRRLTGEKRGSFALTGSNWWKREGVAGRAAWKSDLSLLLDEHKRLRAVIESFPSAGLPGRSGTSRFTARRLIAGVAAHDVYHTGQIRLILKLASGRRS